MEKKKLIIVGTTHEQQKASDAGSILDKKLRHYVRRYGVSVVIEEWKFEDDKTVGKLLADSLSIAWCNAGTPLEEQFETYDPYPIWLDDGSCEPERPYGPIEAQVRREAYMIDKINSAMNDHAVGVFVCGMGHMHSVSEKLHQGGYEVEGFSCLDR
jgi:hypothetical protein